MVANATSVAACVLLGEARPGMFRAQLGERMHQVVELLRLQDVRLTPALAADEPDVPRLDRLPAALGPDEGRERPARRDHLLRGVKDRRALDVYRNVLFHFLVAPSLMARLLLRGGTHRRRAARATSTSGSTCFYREFFAPRAIVHAAQLDAFLDHFERLGALERSDDALRATEKGRSYFAFLAEQTRSLLEAYYGVFSALLALEEPVPERTLEKETAAQFQRARTAWARSRVREGGNSRHLQERARAARAPRRAGARAGTNARELAWGRGPAFDELPALRERLARALLAR